MKGELINKVSDNFCTIEVYCSGGLFTVMGTVAPGFNNNAKLLYRSSEPGDYRQSISGSCLPYANEVMAFGDVNSGTVMPDGNGNFSFKLLSPNSYYKTSDITRGVSYFGVGQGKILVQPILYISLILTSDREKKYELDLGAGVPLRSLTNYPTKIVRSTGRNTPSYFY